MISYYYIEEKWWHDTKISISNICICIHFYYVEGASCWRGQNAHLISFILQPSWPLLTSIQMISLYYSFPHHKQSLFFQLLPISLRSFSILTISLIYFARILIKFLLISSVWVIKIILMRWNEHKRSISQILLLNFFKV